MAKFLAWRAPEMRGILFDYANGQYKILERWSRDSGGDQMLSLVENMFDNANDEIYIAMVKTGASRGGYFIILDSERRTWARFFWGGIYDIEEAMVDVSKYARKVATKMGYRNVEEINENTD
jgi:hypothetical protein